ncbi:MAG: hypothetical protein ACI857_002371 [Arenicella sp.]|jgi:uncharacterized protein YdeI (YjbR/CyaY-like superfamily)
MIELPENNFNPKNRKEWRAWLETNHLEKEGVWLIIYKKSFPKPNLKWDEAASSALCFGWMDGEKKPLDKIKYMQYFGKRKPESIWSKFDKKKVAQFEEEGLMAEAGLKTVETAKQNGFWDMHPSVEQITVPEDLEKELIANPPSRGYFLSLSKSLRQSMLQWVEVSEDAEARKTRITTIVKHAAKEESPEQF